MRSCINTQSIFGGITFFFSTLILFVLFVSPSKGQIYLSGPLSGSLMDTTYIVTGDISIAEEDSLTIEPGATLQFRESCGFDIYGYISAVGEEGDSIIFTLATGTPGWEGIYFHGCADDSSIFEYCGIFGCDDGAVKIDSCSPDFSHCLIYHNHSTNCAGGFILKNSCAKFYDCTIAGNYSKEGGGVYIDCNSNIKFNHCHFYHNTAREHGGAIACYNSVLSIEGCNIENNKIHSYGHGGGIFTSNSELTIQNSLIEGNSINNQSVSGGGGIYCGYSRARIRNTIINNNIAHGSPGGGGTYFYDSIIIIDSCIISNNYSNYWCSGMGFNEGRAGSYITNSLIENNVGSNAIWLWSSNTTIYKCTVRNNTGLAGINIDGNPGINIISYSDIMGNVAHQSYDYGGGIFCGGTGYTLIEHCNVHDNYSASLGGGITIDAYGDSSIIRNCTICANQGNTAGGIYFMYQSRALIENTTVANNIGNSEIGFSYGVTSLIQYCDIYRPQGTIFSGTVPPNLGVLSGVNTNGDSCDVFQNIYLDPQFVNFTGRDFHLLENSPCIDAGNPLSQLNPDSTVADIGAFYFDQEIETFSLPTYGIASTSKILANFPNPFNVITTIPFILEQRSSVKISIYNQLGEEIAVLVEGIMEAGYHQVNWNAERVTSGMYFAKLSVDGGQSSVKKIILLK